MHTRIIGTILLAGALAFAQTPKTRTRSAQNAQTATQKFVSNAALGGMAEIEMGKLAVAKASDPEVKKFGQKMIDDHGKANDELKAIASREGLSFPTSLDAKHQMTIDRLGKLSGAEFDRAYVKEMVKDHEADVKEFDRESKSGSNPQVKAFASKTLPTLQEHLRLIKDIDSRMATKKT